MGAYTGALSFFDDVIKEARKHGYSEDNILILQGDEIALKNDYPETYNNILSCKHHRDRRTPIAYAQDLVSSWLIEDAILYILNNKGKVFKLSGADKNRSVLTASNVGSKSDFVIIKNNRKIELMCDYAGYWVRTGKIDLRDNKYNQLCSEAAYLLGVDILNRKCLVIDFFKKPPRATYIAKHKPFGYKPVYQLSLNREDFVDISAENLLSIIN